MKRFLVLVFICLGIQLYGQNVDDILNKVAETYSKIDNCELQLAFIIYKDSISNEILEKKKAQIIKTQKAYYFKLVDSEIILNSEFFLKINNSEKIIAYNSISAKDIANVVNSNAPILEYFNFFEEKSIKAFDENHWSCSMTKPNKILPYSKVELIIDKKTNFLASQVYHFNFSSEEKYLGKTENTQKERLEIKLLSFNDNIKISTSLFLTETYLIKKNNKIIPSTNYKGYRVLAF